jgi:hypothetical protein
MSAWQARASWENGTFTLQQHRLCVACGDFSEGRFGRDQHCVVWKAVNLLKEKALTKPRIFWGRKRFRAHFH